MDKYAQYGKDPLKANKDFNERQQMPGQRSDPQTKTERNKAAEAEAKDPGYEHKAPAVGSQGVGHVDPADAHSGPPETNPKTAEDDTDAVKTKVVEIPPEVQIDQVVEGKLGGGETVVSDGPVKPQEKTPRS